MPTSTSKRSHSGCVKEIIEKSGYIQRCSDCNRVVHNGHCVVHVDAEIEDDLRVKAKVDSHSNTFIINGSVAEKLLGVSIEEAKELGEEIIKDKIKKDIMNERFTFEGKILSNNFLVDDFKRE